MKKIHVFGASGSGTTKLAKALAQTTGYTHFDTNDFFWEATTPPFQKTRPIEKRIALLNSGLKANDKWILSGSLCGWGDFIIPLTDLVIFLWLPSDVRMERLRLREIERYGPKIFSAQHPNYENHNKFIEWASKYDTAGLEMRSKVLHEQWISGLPCPVLRLDGLKPLTEKIETVIKYIMP